MTDQTIKKIDQEWIDRMNVEFDRLHYEDIERDEKALAKQAIRKKIEQVHKESFEQGQKETFQTIIQKLSQSMNMQQMQEFLEK